MSLKELGRKKKYKKLKCFNCNESIIVSPNEVETIHNNKSMIRIIYCPKCGEQNIIKN